MEKKELVRDAVAQKLYEWFSADTEEPLGPDMRAPWRHHRWLEAADSCVGYVLTQLADGWQWRQ